MQDYSDYEMNDDIDFGVVNDMESEIGGGDSLGLTGREQFDCHLADFVIETIYVRVPFLKSFMVITELSE
jgi:hypothetical protein